MHCDVYKFKKDGWYAFIHRPNYPNDADILHYPLAILPPIVQKTLGLGQFVMHLDLSVRKKLAGADISTVCQSLMDCGYYIQSPPHETLLQQAAVSSKGVDNAQC